MLALPEQERFDELLTKADVILISREEFYRKGDYSSIIL